MRLILKYLLRGFGKIITFFVPQKREYFNYQLPSKIYQKFFIKNIIFLNVGTDCRAALHLKAHLLRKLSAPLDWIMCYSLNDAYLLYKSEFRDFFSVCSEDISRANDDKRFVIADNGMVAMHHFPLGVEIRAYLPTFQCVMQNRFQRLKAEIVKAKSVVFVAHRADNIESLKDFTLKMQELINLWCEKCVINGRKKHIFLVNILHNENAQGFERQIHKVGDNVEIIQFVFDDSSTNQNHWLGNKKLWGKVMSEIEVLG